MAFTLEVKKQYNGELSKVIEKHPELIQITEIEVKVLFEKIKICLLFIILGTVLQFPMN